MDSYSAMIAFPQEFAIPPINQAQLLEELGGYAFEIFVGDDLKRDIVKPHINFAEVRFGDKLTLMDNGYIIHQPFLGEAVTLGRTWTPAWVNFLGGILIDQKSKKILLEDGRILLLSVVTDFLFYEASEIKNLRLIIIGLVMSDLVYARIVKRLEHWGPDNGFSISI